MCWVLSEYVFLSNRIDHNLRQHNSLHVLLFQSETGFSVRKKCGMGLIFIYQELSGFLKVACQYEVPLNVRVEWIVLNYLPPETQLDSLFDHLVTILFQLVSNLS